MKTKELPKWNHELDSIRDAGYINEDLLKDLADRAANETKAICNETKAICNGATEFVAKSQILEGIERAACSMGMEASEITRASMYSAYVVGRNDAKKEASLKGWNHEANSIQDAALFSDEEKAAFKAFNMAFKLELVSTFSDGRCNNSMAVEVIERLFKQVGFPVTPHTRFMLLFMVSSANLFVND